MIRYFSRNKTLNNYYVHFPKDYSSDDVVWVDLNDPTADERELVTQNFEIHPLQEIEQRMFKQPNWHDPSKDIIIFGIPFSPAYPNNLHEVGIIFILTRQTLITKHNLGFDIAGDMISQGQFDTNINLKPEDLLISLLEYLLIHFSEKAESINMSIGELSKRTFVTPNNKTRLWGKSKYLRNILENIGRIGSVSISLNDNLRWLERIPLFLQMESKDRFCGTRLTRLKSIREDVINLIESVVFIQQQTTLVLDATLGIINLEENFVMRWLTVIATIFIPPTLIASIYGMNFSEISTIGGQSAFLIALILVFLSALIPIFFFLRRGWL